MVSTAATPGSLIDFRLLGPLSVTVDGETVPVGGPRQMAVLARLMLTPDQVVTMDQLVESVWDGDEPTQPHVAIRSYVSNLRRAIEPNRRRRASDSCLASSPPGYRLAIDAASVDWVRFERLVNEGRRRVTDGDHAGAIDRLRDADELWKGDPCSGLPESQIFLGHRGRLTKLRETAVELLFEASLLQGDHAFVVGQVEAAIAEHPLRERLTELGMMAFYRAGRQSEALGLGRQLRARLLEGLGIDPSPAIGEMELKILNHDPSLGPLRDPVVEVTKPPPPGDQVARSIESSDTASAPPQDRPVGGADPEALVAMDGAAKPVGRDRELAALGRIGPSLRSGRSMTVVLTGEQGIGKTALAAAAASQLAAEGVSVAWSRGVPDETPELWSWSQVLLSLIEDSNVHGPLEVTPDLLPLRALGPSIAGAIGLDPASPAEDHDQAEVMMAVVRLLQRLDRRAPLTLVFEDLQWADQATIQLIGYVASTLLDSPVAFILTWRETDLEVGPDHPRLRELVRLPRMIRLELDGLDSAAVSQLATLAGHPLSAGDCVSIQARCGGNPLFIKEILAHSSIHVTDGRRWSTLVDAVRDRIDQLDPAALQLLNAASLIRTPFTIGSLSAATGLDGATAQGLLNLAVRGGILIDADQMAGSYRFRHPLIAEVLASELLAVDRAATHQTIGHHLLATEGPGGEVAFHLSRSPSAEDRVLAARMALERLHDRFEARDLAEIDDVVAIGMTAADLLGSQGHRPLKDAFVIDALAYVSWRAWVDGEPVEWMENGSRALDLAMDAAADVLGTTKTQGRTKVPSLNQSRTSDATGTDGEFERLNNCAMNLLGSPTLPVGPTRTFGFAEIPESRLQELATLAENLGGEHPLKWSIQVNLGYRESLSKPGVSNRAKAVKEAQKVVSNARRRLTSADAASVQMYMISRFCDAMDPAARVAGLTELSAMRPGLRTELFRVRYGYPALLELGRTYEAERLVLQTYDAIVSGGDQLLLAEARMLRIRHLLWTGQLQTADSALDVAIADWAALGLVEPVPFVRQRRTVRLLSGRRVSGGHGPDTHHQLMVERARTPELALRLARIGDRKRATECLETTIEHIGVDHVSLSDQALIAMAASHLEHEKASLLVYELLATAGDQAVVRADGSTILGPASLYAGLVADVAGLESEATEHLDSARRALHRFGGSPASMDAVLLDVGHRMRSNPLPTNS